MGDLIDGAADADGGEDSSVGAVYRQGDAPHPQKPFLVVDCVTEGEDLLHVRLQLRPCAEGLRCLSDQILPLVVAAALTCGHAAEKDLAAGLLAEELNADTLLILTSVENVSLNHGQVNEQKLGSITVADAKKYIEENQFASGSMLPKIEAGISFIEKGEGRSTVITDMAHAKEGYEGKTGTTIR